MTLTPNLRKSQVSMTSMVKGPIAPNTCPTSVGCRGAQGIEIMRVKRIYSSPKNQQTAKKLNSVGSIRRGLSARMDGRIGRG